MVVTEQRDVRAAGKRRACTHELCRKCACERCERGDSRRVSMRTQWHFRSKAKPEGGPRRHASPQSHESTHFRKPSSHHVCTHEFEDTSEGRVRNGPRLRRRSHRSGAAGPSHDGLQARISVCGTRASFKWGGREANRVGRAHLCCTTRLRQSVRFRSALSSRPKLEQAEGPGPGGGLPARHQEFLPGLWTHWVAHSALVPNRWVETGVQSETHIVQMGRCSDGSWRRSWMKSARIGRSAAAGCS